MSERRIQLILTLVLTLIATDAGAAQRGVRVDGGNGWTQYSIGTANCSTTTAGSTAADTLVHRLGFTFSGRENTAYLVSDYCQVADASTLTSANYTYFDEPDLAHLFSDNTGNAISGIRYSFLDDVLFGTPTGFQWGFYTFPGNVVVIALYGLQTVTLDSTSYITPGVWSGTNGYNGEYFCFQGGVYIGTWTALTDTNNACLHALGVVFVNGFE
jgi:hypothetical protein